MGNIADRGQDRHSTEPKGLDSPAPSRWIPAAVRVSVTTPAGPRDLIALRVRRELRELAVAAGTLRTIAEAFEDEGFHLAGEPDYSDGMRRGLFDAYDRGVAWSDRNEVARALRVFEEILSWDNEDPRGPRKVLVGKLRRLLDDDGYTLDGLTAALSCVDPGTGERLGRQYTAGGTYLDPLGVRRLRRSLSAFDLTYSVPKSISAAWALADPATRRELQAAFDVSVQAVVDYIQTHAVASRKGRNGVERIDVPDGAAIARFDHYTSRAGDPQLHAHLLVMNRVLCSDGKWRTLDGHRIYRHLQAASM